MLADLKEWNTAGAIAKAAEAERATAARVSLTTSWARLDKTGVAKLARMCRGDGSISGLGRLYASQALQDHFASEECFDSLVRFVGTPSKADEIPRAEIALTLDSYKQSLTDPGKRRLAIKALSQLLRAEDSYTRVAAATALFNIGDPAGLVPLTEAVAREHSSGLQNILQGILSDLQARTRPVKQP